MLVMAFLQFLLVGGAILISKVIPNLNENAYEIFYKTISNRKSYIESEMHNRWAAIDNYLAHFSKVYPDKEAPLNEREALAYFNEAAPELIDMLRNSSTTGAFIILNNGTEDTANSCLFITDGDPLHNNTINNSDLLVLKGPLELTETMKIPLHIAWNYGITLTEDISAMYEQPYSQAVNTGSNEHLGYWGIVPSLYVPNTNSIIYSKPLIDDTGYVFGVAGIEISQEYFYKLLPSSELMAGTTGGYALITQDAQGNYVPAMTQGAQLQKLIPYGQTIRFTMENEQFNGNTFVSGGYELGACYQQLTLYNKNTPFDSTKWYLLGITPGKELTRYADSLTMAVYLALAISFCVGIVLAVLAGLVTTRSSSVLLKRIREFEPGKKMILDKTGITEIDELSGAVEQLNEKVFSYALKTDKIISMVNLDIGSFEYDTLHCKVKISKALANMLSFTADETESVPVGEFNRRLEEIRKNRTEENIFKYQEEPPKWLKLEAMDTDSGRIGIVVDVTKDVLTRRAIIRERDHDVLTGIYNRYAFQKHIMELFAQRNFTCGAFVMGDMDNLKHINDMYGHDQGDMYIYKTAKVIERFLANQQAIYGRMSGDEFYMFIYGSSEEEISRIVYDLHYEINCESIRLPDDTIFKLKISCGVAWYPRDSELPEELTRYADFAMYQGKHSVKGGIREFESISYRENSYLFTGKEELYTILDEQLCDYVFQPVYDVRSRRVFGYEALMRPYGKNVNTPDRLIHLALAQGQLYKVEHNTFYMVLELCRKYQPMLEDKKIFINSVPNEVLKEKEYEELETIYGNLLDKVVIEITESETINDTTMRRKKELVKKWNALLALDDYGSGYANDLSLIHLHPHIIKIDRMMVDGAEEDKDKRALIGKIIAFAGELGIEVLAEGVETREQLELLLELGIDYVQGYYICRPSPLPNFDDSGITAVIQEIRNKIKDN